MYLVTLALTVFGPYFTKWEGKFTACVINNQGKAYAFRYGSCGVIIGMLSDGAISGASTASFNGCI
jgi:hypothetical protein